MNRCILALFACALAAPSAADPGTAFTYQGRLDNGGVPVQGTVSLRFSLHDAATAGMPVGATIDRIDTTAIDGVVIETLDFGGVFDGGPRWLQIEVDADGGSDSFVTLGDRVATLPVPYAVYAENAGTASVALNDAVDDADADPTNELQTLSFASPSLSITGGNSVDLSSLVPSGADGHSLDADDGDPVDALYVDADGNVGIGTVEPSGKLDIHNGYLAFSGEQVDQKNNNASIVSSTRDLWQSFTPSVSGRLVAFEFVPSSSTGDYFVYRGEGTGGTLLGSGSTSPTAGVLYKRVTLDTLVSMTAGQVYTFRFVAPSSNTVRWSDGNPYAGGRMSDDGSGDLRFATFMGTAGSGGIQFGDGTTQSTVDTLSTVLSRGTDAGGADISNLGVVSAISFAGDGSALTNVPVPGISSLDADGGSPADVLVVDDVGRVQAGSSGVFVGQLGQLRCDGLGLELATRDVTTDVAQDSSNSSNGADVQQWQSFTAGVSGQLAGVQVHRASGAPESAVVLYEGEGTNGTVLSATMIPALSSTGWQFASFPIPVSATAGDVFTVQLSNGSDWNLNVLNPYSGGRAKTSVNSDHRFRTFMLDTSEGNEYATALHVNLSDQFVGILNADPDYPLEVGTDTTNGNGAHVTTGGTWTNGSSRTFKENFAALDPAEILAKVCALPVTGWNYVGSDEGQHIGPMAEDFHAAFGLGDSEKYISTVDADGVAFAAIQGLKSENDGLRAQNEALLARTKEIEARLAKLEAMLAEGGASSRNGN